MAVLVLADMDEASLLAAARRGDDDAFAVLVERTRSRVESVTRGIVGPEDAADVTQETYVRAWQALPRFDGRASFSTWLHRIAANTARSARRRAARGRRRFVRIEQAPEPAFVPDEAGSERERLLAAMEGALQDAAPSDRRLLAMRFTEGRSYDSIASDLGIVPATVGTRLLRARARVRKLAERHLAALLVALVLLVASAVGDVPTSLARLGQFLRSVVLHEQTVTQPPEVVRPRRAASVSEAQAQVAWTIHTLPDDTGFVLRDVFVGDLHAFADGATVWLHYQSAVPAARDLDVVQVRAAEPAPEPVAPGASWRQTLLDGQDALVIDGRWVQDGSGVTWERGRVLRVIVEREDGVVLQLQGDPRDGWTVGELLALASRLR